MAAEATDILVCDLEQWRLLIHICPLLEGDLHWTPPAPQGVDTVFFSHAVNMIRATRRAGGTDEGLPNYFSEGFSPHARDAVVLMRHAEIFSAEMSAIKVQVNSGTVLGNSTRDTFERRINGLLSTLELLVSETVSASLDHEAIHEALGRQPALAERCPKLLLLEAQIELRREEGRISECSQYLNLEQRPNSFKSMCKEVIGFNIEIPQLLNKPISASQIRTSNAHRQKGLTKFVSSFSGASQRLFSSLIDRLQICGQPSRKHQARLQLKHISGQISDIDGPPATRLSTLLSPCSLHSVWLPAELAIGVQPAPSDTATDGGLASHADLCNDLVMAHHANRSLEFCLYGSRLINVSNPASRPQRPGGQSDVSLQDMLELGVLKNAYQFYLDDKNILAFVLAQALLHLYGGPWIQRLWTLNNVIFRYDHGSGRLLNAHEPYIALDFPSASPVLENLDASHKYPLILSFGKLLWELKTGLEVKPAKNRKDELSLLSGLREQCGNVRKSQTASGYDLALDACINFSIYLLKERRENPGVAINEQDVILKHIVHKLEWDVDLSRGHDWGHADLYFSLPDSTADDFDSLSDEDDLILRDIMDEARPPVTPPSPTPKRAAPSLSHAVREQSGLGASTHPLITKQRTSALARGRGTRSSSNVPMRNLHKTTTRSGVPGQKSAALSNRAAPDKGKAVAPRRPVPALKEKLKNDQAITSELARTAHSRSSQKPGVPSARLSSQYSRTGADLRALGDIGGNHTSGSQPRENAARGSDAQSESSTLDSGFGDCHLFTVSEINAAVSTRSFNTLHNQVDEYWQHHQGSKYSKGDPCVRIAILDTGIDLDHEDFQQARTKRFTGKLGDQAAPAPGEVSQVSRIKGWKNFCPDQAEEDVTDVDGHGTQVAGIVLRLAPVAELYIARICTGDSNNGVSVENRRPVQAKAYHRPQYKAIEDAIDWAMEHKVHVINLSAGFRSYLLTDIESLKRKLLDVQYHSNRWHHNAVVFAATSNEGAHEPVAWPAKDPKCALGIHSCGDTGTQKSDFTGRAFEGDNFMVVGERILAPWVTSKGGGFRACTGTSFATPVASAIAALVLQFAWQKACRQYDRPATMKLLHTNGGMASVLKEFSSCFDGSYLFISMKLFWGSAEYDINVHRDAKLFAWERIKSGLARA